MIDAVLSSYLNPATSGVAKFNLQLAQRLGVPCELLSPITSYQHPLISIKTSDIKSIFVGYWFETLPPHGDLLLHDRPDFVPTRRRIFYADELGCPSTIDGDASRGAYRVLAFGMAHKLALPHFQRLKQDLDRDHPDYTIELSTAVHEGHPWDQALMESTAAMREMFGRRLRVLGFLADDALVRVLHEVDAVAAFYEPALRANNTTAWAVLDAGKTLYTNRDAQSPTVAPTWAGIIDVLTRAPLPADGSRIR